jgi:hypothetical protein
VLEIGGCSPIAELQRLSPRSRTCVDLNREAVVAFGDAAARCQARNFSACVQDAAMVTNSRFRVSDLNRLPKWECSGLLSKSNAPSAHSVQMCATVS